MIATLPPALTIHQVAELRATLLAALASGEPLALDGRAVVEVDAAGLQVLCAAQRSAEERGTAFGFAPGGRSAALERAVELAGLSHLALELHREGT